MPNRRLRVLQVSTLDVGGGAEKIAWNLFQNYRLRGIDSWLAVGNKCTDDPNVLQIMKPNPWSQVWLALERRLQPYQGYGRLISHTRAFLRIVAQPRRELDIQWGREDFNFPGARRLLELPPHKPDIVHCHNLHGGYFDLRVLPRLSEQRPLMLTLHDAWLLSGHCGHSFDCDRWKIGCGQCPDLAIYPAIGRDATAYNWRRKKNIFSRSRIYLATPSKWLMRKVEQSLLRPYIAESRVIPNGVDLSVFRPAEKGAARTALGLSQEAAIVLFAAHRAQTNIYKDYKTLRVAMEEVAQKMTRPLLFLCLGGDAGIERTGNAELRSVSYEKNPNIVAQYYQAADLYVHASRADTFPCSVLEALACGTPVIASNVGGIPEQIKGWGGLNSKAVDVNRYGANDATGALVPTGDPEAIAEGVRSLLRDDSLRHQMSKNASTDVRKRFDVKQQADQYLQWYTDLTGKACVTGCSSMRGPLTRGTN